MQHAVTFPHTKAYMGRNGVVHYQPCFIKEENVIYTEPLVGQQLIKFLEVDMTEFGRRLDALIDGREEWSFEVFQERSYDSYTKELWAIMELLKPQHIYAHGYLISQFNQILNKVIYLEDASVDALLDIQISDIVMCMEALDAVLALHSRFSDIASLCLDRENLTDNTAAVRFAAVLFKYPRYKKFALKTAVTMSPTKNGLLDGERMQEIFQLQPTDTQTLLDEVHKTYDKGVSLLNYTILETLEELLYFELCEMLKNGLMAKKCKLCGKYFVSKDNRKREYCDRPYVGNKTCRMVGAKMLHKQKTEDDPFLARYEDIRQTYYSRKYRADGKATNELSGKDMTDGEYAAWSELATRERERYMRGEISGEQLIAHILRD